MKSTARRILKWGAFGVMSIASLALQGQCTAVIGTSIDPVAGCEMLTVQFYDNSAAVASRSWDFGDGSEASNAQNPTHTFSAGDGDTTYTVTLSVECTSGEVSEATREVTVYASPRIDFTQDKHSLCAISDSVCFTNLSSELEGNNYLWNFGDGTISEGFEPCKVYHTPGTYNLELTVTNGHGCVNSSIVEDYIEVVPVPNTAFLPSEITGCAPFTALFTNNTDTLGNSYSGWTWDFGDGSSTQEGFLTPPHTYMDPGKYLIKLGATNELGCYNFSTQTITVHPSPVASFQATNPNCLNQGAVFQFDGEASDSALFSWSFDAPISGDVGTGPGPHVKRWNEAGIKEVTLQVNDRNCSAAATEQIVVNPLSRVELDISTNIDTICEGEEVTFTALPDQYSRYQFYLNTTLVQDSPENSYTGAGLQSGDRIHVRITDQLGCSELHSDTVNLTVIPLPAVDLYSSAGASSICDGEEVTFTAAPASFEEYVFYLGNEEVQRGASPIWTSSQLNDGARVRVEVPGSHCGRVASPTLTTSVLDILPAPDVNCAETGLDFVRFSWDEVEGAFAYMVRVNGAGFAFPSGGPQETWHQVDGLTEGDAVTLEVRAVRQGDCSDGAISEPRICIAQVCTGIDFELPIRDSAVCEGSEILLMAENMSPASWSLSWDGDPAGQDSLFSIRPEESGLIRVVLVDSTQLHCQPVEKNIHLEVIPTPSLNLTAPKGMQLCEGMELELEALPGSYERYMFFRNSAILQDSVSSRLVDGEPRDGQIYFVVAENAHCIEASDTLRVEVRRPLSPPNVSVLDSDLTSITFQWNPVEGATGYLVRIDNEDFIIPSSGAQGMTHRVDGLQPGQGINAMAIALSDGSCGNSDPSPPAVGFAEECQAISYALDRDWEICEGEEIMLRISELNLDNYTVSWGTGAPGEQLSRSIAPAQDSVVRISIRNLDEAVCPAKVEYVRVRVTPRPPKPVLISSVGSGPICEGASLRLEAKPAGLPAYDFYDGFKLLQSGYSNEIYLDSWTHGHSPRVLARDGACASEATALPPISVHPPLHVPQVNCHVSTDTSITFAWDPVPGATGYLVRVDGAVAMAPSTGAVGLEHLLEGLAPGEMHSISVQATGSGPCGNSAWSDTITCQSIPCDLISFDITPYDTICAGEGLDLEIRNISTSSYSLAWNGTDAGMQNSLLFEGTSDSIVHVELRDLDQAACATVKKRFHIKVNPLPLATLTALTDSICEGEEVGFLAEPAGYDSYRFYSEAGSLLQDSAWHYVYTDTLSRDFSLYVESTLKGCSHVSELEEVAVTELPELRLEAAASGDICRGQLVRFTATPGFDRYLFRDGHRLIMDSQDPSVYMPIRSTVVTVQAYKGDDCLVNSVDTLRYVLKDLPRPELQSSMDEICPGASVTFTVTPVADNTTDFASYEFYQGGTLLGSGDAANFTAYYFEDLEDVHAYVYSSEGCKSLPSNSVAVSVKDFPENRIASDVEGICLGDSASLWVELDSSMSTQYFYWSSGGRDSVLRVSPEFDQSYYLYSSANGCTQLSDTLHLGVDREEPPLAYAGEDLTICISDSIQLQGSGGLRHNWAYAGLESDTLGQEPWVRSDSTIALVLTATNRYCASKDTMILAIDRCLQDLGEAVPQIITPNGDQSNDVWVVPDIDYFTGNKVEIYNRWGSQVFFASPYMNTWDGTSATGELLPEGTYYYLIDLGQGAPPRTGYIIIHR